MSISYINSIHSDTYVHGNGCYTRHVFQRQFLEKYCKIDLPDDLPVRKVYVCPLGDSIFFEEDIFKICVEDEEEHKQLLAQVHRLQYYIINKEILTCKEKGKIIDSMQRQECLQLKICEIQKKYKNQIVQNSSFEKFEINLTKRVYEIREVFNKNCLKETEKLLQQLENRVQLVTDHHVFFQRRILKEFLPLYEEFEVALNFLAYSKKLDMHQLNSVGDIFLLVEDNIDKGDYDRVVGNLDRMKIEMAKLKKIVASEFINTTKKLKL